MAIGDGRARMCVLLIVFLSGLNFEMVLAPASRQEEDLLMITDLWMDPFR